MNKSKQGEILGVFTHTHFPFQLSSLELSFCFPSFFFFFFCKGLIRRCSFFARLHMLSSSCSQAWNVYSNQPTNQSNHHHHGTFRIKQSINKTSNNVQLLHKPTGIRVTCQETRSLQTNRMIARRNLLEKESIVYRLLISSHLRRFQISEYRVLEY